MNTHEYDATLFYLHRMACEELTTVMAITKDDMLAKKIEKLVEAFMYDPEITNVEKAYEALLCYLEHVFVSHLDKQELM